MLLVKSSVVAKDAILHLDVSASSYILTSTQFGSVQPQVSALACDTAGAGAATQWSSVANDAGARPSDLL